MSALLYMALGRWLVGRRGWVARGPAWSLPSEAEWQRRIGLAREASEAR